MLNLGRGRDHEEIGRDDLADADPADVGAFARRSAARSTGLATPIAGAATIPASAVAACEDRPLALGRALAPLATLLAAIGLYGVLAYTVAQRTREIGLRMALGAAPNRVRGMVLRQVAIMTLVGTLVGLAGALGVGKGAQSILFQMTGADPTVLALSAVALALVALCAGFIPAHRASRVDPMRALKYE